VTDFSLDADTVKRIIACGLVAPALVLLAEWAGGSRGAPPKRPK